MAGLFAKNGAECGRERIVDDIGLEAVDEINASGGRAVYIRADVSDSKEARALADKTVEEFGQIDIFVNNAA